MLILAIVWFGIAMVFAGLFLWQREQTLNALDHVYRLLAELRELRPPIKRPKIRK